MSYVPESVKVLTVTTRFKCGCVTAWSVEQGQPTPLTCPVHRAIWERTDSEPVVPQAELDRLRAVGEELARVVAEGADQLDAIDYGERILYSPGVVRDDLASALKSYREAVPEQLRRADDGDASEQMEGGP